MPDNWDCEKRSRSKQGREEIERIKIQARNQRLKLYNAHLWDMFSHSHSFSRQHLNKARSLFGESWCEQTSILVRHEWGRSLSDVYTFMDAAVQDIGSQAQNNKLDEHYLLQCDIRLHHAICCEVADFLATNTAGFVFHKIFKAVLMQAANVSDKFSVSDWKRVSAAAHISSISIAIAATKWTEEIQRQSTQEVIRA
ncbi:MAG TPA: hypothetical protein V6C57_06645 [Coleofasciculaceae cyanobacterium]